MKFHMKNIIKSSTLLVVLSLIIFSCSKNNDGFEPSLQLQHEQATIPNIDYDTIYGRWANPASGPFAFDTVYFNVETGAHDSIGAITYNLVFYGFNNSTLNKADPADELKYLNTTTAFASIGFSDYSSATDVPSTGFSENGATDFNNNPPGADGWWNYDPINHIVEHTRNVVLFYRKAGLGNPVIAFQFTRAWGDGVPALNRGRYALQRGIVQ